MARAPAATRLGLGLGLDRSEFAVFASGVASMGLEILAGRLVAPEFGGSVYTWGSVIGVSLAALSLGYHRGGRRAAERASDGRLAWLLLAAAAYVVVPVLAGDALVAATTRIPLPARFAALPAVTVLFGPPTYLLGFVSPYAAELATATADGAGAASGRVYAVGTVGSIVGAFGTTFLLVPALGVVWIGLAFGLTLAGAALVVAGPAPDRGAVAVVALVACLLVAAAGAGAAGGVTAVSPGGRVVVETETAYQELRVVDRDGVRTLFLDGQPHSAMDLDAPTRHVFAYTRYFHLPYLLVDDPDEIDRVLFVGGGGFTGPRRFLAEYDATVDVVEIDPAVVRVAREQFRVGPAPRLTVHVGDGRRFLRETDRRYDLIVLDAYRKDEVPFHLTTVEFMQLVRDRLAPDGTVVANLISAPRGPASRFFRAEYRTVDRVFPQTYVFPTRGGRAVQNIELVATRRDERLSRAELATRARARERAIGIDLSGAVANHRASVRTDDVPVLRDDRAPVDTLLDPALDRRYVVGVTTPTPTPTPTPNGSEPTRSAAPAPVTRVTRHGRPAPPAAQAPSRSASS